MAPKVEKRPYYDVYPVGEDYIILPEGGKLSKLWERQKGNRVVEVVDINGDGPGNGDTVYLRNGKRVDNVQFSGPRIIPTRFRREYYWELAFHESAEKNLRYDIERIEPGSLTAFCVYLAGSMQSYGSDRVEEVRDIADSVTDNSVAAGAIVAGAIALSLHPTGRVLMEAVGLAGAVGGTGYIVHDRIDGVAHGKPMGRHDLTAGLAIVGGASALRGMTVEGVWQDTMNGLGRTMKFLEGGGGVGFSPGLVGAGANGGSIIFSGEAAATAAIAAEASASAVATGGRLTSAVTGIPISRLVATFANGGGGPQTREVRFSDEFVPDEAAWLTSQAKGSADQIRTALEMTIEDLEATGQTEQAAQVANVLEEVTENLDVIAELYKRLPEEAAQKAIQKVLGEVEAGALQLLEQPAAETAGSLLEGIRARMGVMRELAQRFRIASFKVPSNGSGANLTLPEVPDGIELAQPLEEMLPNPEKKRFLVRALERYFRNFSGGNHRKYKRLTGAGDGLTEVQFLEAAGPRIYLVFKEGRPVILRIGDKDTQMRDIHAAKELAKQLGLLQLFVYVVDGQGEVADAGKKRRTSR